MGLEADDTGDQAGLAPRIVPRWPRVFPVAGLDAVDPDRKMAAMGDDRLVEELSIFGNDLAGRNVEVESPGAEVMGLPAVAVAELVSDLRLVPAPEDPLLPPEEDAAVGVVAGVGRIGADRQLQHQILELLLGLQLSGALLHVEDAVPHRPFMHVVPVGTIDLPPTVQVLSIEQRAQSQRLELDVAELDGLVHVVLQPDRTHGMRRVVGIENFPAVELDHKAASHGTNFVLVPLAALEPGRFGLDVEDQAAGVVALRLAVEDLQFIPGLVRRTPAGRAQKDAAVPVLRSAKLQFELEVGEHAGGAQPTVPAAVGSKHPVLHLPACVSVPLPTVFGLAVPEQDPSRRSLLGGERVVVRCGGRMRRQQDGEDANQNAHGVSPVPSTQDADDGHRDARCFPQGPVPRNATAPYGTRNSRPIQSATPRPCAGTAPGALSTGVEFGIRAEA